MMTYDAYTERIKRLLPDEWEEFLRASACPPSLRINTLKMPPARLETLLGMPLDPVEWCADGRYYPEEFAAGKTSLHEAGAYYIQEASAMLPAVLLDARPGELVLDLCAAPGGKSGQLAAAMRGEGLLVCNEVVPSRAAILSRNIERLGVRNAVVLNESVPRLQNRFPSAFDKILVDAPCSGEGMFAKDPNARAEWTADSPSICAARQKAILDSAAAMLKAGGTLCYSTCTFAPEENELQVEDFLRSHPEFELAQLRTAIPQPRLADFVPKDVASKCVRVMPHLARGNGHFCALMRKTDGDDISLPRARYSVPHAMARVWDDFAKNALKTTAIVPNAAFGDSLVMLPDCCPDLTGLKTLRSGLRLGDVVKGRLAPSHSLAAALSADDATSALDLPHDSRETRDYLFGATLEGDARGWCLIAASGCSLGWGKGSDGTIKNHYPKGLRPTRSH